MDDLAFLRERIKSYADYTNYDARRQTDEQVRAYIGEALSQLQERLRPAGDAGDALSRVLFHCEFADQRLVRAFDADDLCKLQMPELRRADRELITLADRAAEIGSNDVAAFADQIQAALDARSHIVVDGVAGSPQLPPR